MAAGWFKHPKDIPELWPQRLPQGLTFGFTGHYSATEALGRVHIPVLKGDVEIPHHHQRIPLAPEGLQGPLQAGQPFQFVGVLRGFQRGAVGNIEIDHPDPINEGADDPLLIGQALGLGIVAQQSIKADTKVFQRQTAEDRHTVVGLLATENSLISKGLDGLPREKVITHLGFLQAEDVRTLLRQPGEHLVQPDSQRIDVPGGDPHAGLSAGTI